jgi:hypothetical protein
VQVVDMNGRIATQHGATVTDNGDIVMRHDVASPVTAPSSCETTWSLAVAARPFEGTVRSSQDTIQPLISRLPRASEAR